MQQKNRYHLVPVIIRMILFGLEEIRQLRLLRLRDGVHSPGQENLEEVKRFTSDSKKSHCGIAKIFFALDSRQTAVRICAKRVKEQTPQGLSHTDIMNYALCSMLRLTHHSYTCIAPRMARYEPCEARYTVCVLLCCYLCN